MPLKTEINFQYSRSSTSPEYIVCSTSLAVGFAPAGTSAG